MSPVTAMWQTFWPKTGYTPHGELLLMSAFINSTMATGWWLMLYDRSN